MDKFKLLEKVYENNRFTVSILFCAQQLTNLFVIVIGREGSGEGERWRGGCWREEIITVLRSKILKEI